MHKPSSWRCRRSRFASWLLADVVGQSGGHRGGPLQRPRPAEAPHHPWWMVMCLTGVDYFSTLGYQPGLAAIAAGALAPLATIVLVALTLAGALPVYRRVAQESPHGEGSIAMLARLLPGWRGKVFVLVLLGFAATDFIITITLSAADGAAHLVQNPYVPAGLHNQTMTLTLILLGALALVFLRGFQEAIGVATIVVCGYLALNAVVVVVSLWHIVRAPSLVTDWTAVMTAQHGSPWMMIAVSLLVFPKLALGLSGFETGVAVMPQIKGDRSDTESHPAGRIRGTRRLLNTAALIMSAFLITSSLVTTVEIPAAEFAPGGRANGRALAFLAHHYLGDRFGTAYDIATMAILSFAGASAMAGLLNLVPRFLPRFGMAPEWARADRPLVLVFTAVAVAITAYFHASVDAQGAAYATGVLVVITSATVAVSLSAARKQQRAQAVWFAAVTAIFVYTTIANAIERPEGAQVAALFIAAILAVSFISRFARAFELRAVDIDFDATAQRFVAQSACAGAVHIICHHSHHGGPTEYQRKLAAQRRESYLPAQQPVLFLEVHVKDPSEFSSELHVRGIYLSPYQILCVRSAAAPNAIAAILLKIRDDTHVNPHVYFEWTEGNPLTNLLRFLFTGEGEVPMVTREILRRAEPDYWRRPHVHVDS